MPEKKVDLAVPSAVPIEWRIIDKRVRRRRVKALYVKTKYWIDAKELGSMKYGIPYDYVQAVPKKPW